MRIRGIYVRVAHHVEQMLRPSELELQQLRMTARQIRKVADEPITAFLDRYQRALHLAWPEDPLESQANFERIVEACDDSLRRQAARWK